MRMLLMILVLCSGCAVNQSVNLKVKTDDVKSERFTLEGEYQATF